MGSPVGYYGRVRVTRYAALRIVLGLVLLTTAALKGHQLATEPVAATGLLSSRWFLIAVVEFELFFGLWLLAGLYPRRTWAAALLCFSGFGCVSLYRALSGESTCGCFGRVPVNPWYTLLLDLAAVTALLHWRPATNPARSLLPLAGEGPGVRAGFRGQLACILGISLLVALPAALVMASYQAATLDEAGDIFGDSEFVVLEPEKWVGKPFPLLKYIDISDQLAEGEWIVVLYHHECPSCQDALPKYEQLRRGSAVAAEKASVALVEMPPYGSPEHGVVLHGSRCLQGRLSDAKEWFIKTPVTISVNRGIVKKLAGREALGL